MKRKHTKGKGQFKLSIIALFLLTLVLGTIYAGSSSNKTSNLETSLGNVAINETNPGPFTEQQFVKAVLDVAIEGCNVNGTHYDYMDCSTYVGRVLEHFSGVSIYPTNTKHFISAYGPSVWYAEELGMTYQGQSYVMKPIMTANSDKTKPWYERIDATKLRPGDIICSWYHMFIYVGKTDNASDTAQIKQILDNIYSPDTFEYSTRIDTVLSNTLNLCADENGSQYWYIEGTWGSKSAFKSPQGYGMFHENPNVNRPVLRNYKWISSEGGKNLEDFKVFRVTRQVEKTGGYALKIAKADKNGSATSSSYLAGSEFSIALQKNESTEKLYYTSRLEKVTDDTAVLSPQSTNDYSFVEPGLSIDSIDKVDIYTIKETKPPTGYQHTGAGESLILKVHKKEASENTYGIDYVEIDGITTNVNPGESILLDDNLEETTDENNYMVSIEVEEQQPHSAHAAIKVLWRDEQEQTPTGSFKLQIVKQDSKTDEPLDGARFSLKLQPKESDEYLHDWRGRILNGEADYMVDNGTGKLTFSGINLIPDSYAGETNYPQTIEYTATISETVVPEGYTGIAGNIVFDLTAQLVTDATTSEQHYELTPGTIRVENAKSVNVEEDFVQVVVDNTAIPEGMFTLNVIKKDGNSGSTLDEGEFEVSIVNKNDDEDVLVDSLNRRLDGSKFEIINNEGLVFRGIKLDKEATYAVTINETTPPEGYEGLSEPITFDATAQLVNGEYVLAPSTPQVAEGATVTITNNKIDVQVNNERNAIGKFRLMVYKYKGGTYEKISGAAFKVKIQNKATEQYVVYPRLNRELDGSNDWYVDSEGVLFGILSFSNLALEENAEYDVTIVESVVPQGYTGAAGEIKFTARTITRDGELVLEPGELTVENARSVAVTDSSIIMVEVENEEVVTHKGKVGLYKYVDVNKNGRYDAGEPSLAGAKFKIASTRENAINGVFIKGSNGRDIEVTAAQNGTAGFTNLDLGTETTKQYYVVETFVPNGYQIITDGPIEVTAKETGYDMNDISTLVQIGNTAKIYDLSLRKFITAVKDGVSGEETEVTNRVPEVDLTKLKSGESTTAEYNHTKEPVLLHTSDTVTYTIRVYNEGPEDAYASLVKDDIPDGLEFVKYTSGDGSINDTYGWKLVDENNNEVSDISKAKYVLTSYLEKDADETNLIKAFNPSTSEELDYRDLKIQFKVTEPTTSDRILTNKAQISEERDSDNKIVSDRDSTPDEWKEEDDEDVEHVKVQYFDLALRKWVTEAIVIENGKTVVHETGHKAEDDPEDVVKVDLNKKKVNDVTVKFKYSIRITNEGQIAGEATEIRDDIPEGLKFVQEDNPDWKEVDGEVVTDKLANTTLEPGESAEVEIILTWINSENNLGVKDNVAEISKDHNVYGTPDIDSTPGNKVPGEDDIDNAPVMLSIKTGSEVIKYAGLGLGILVVITIAGKAIKKKVLSI